MPVTTCNGSCSSDDDKDGYTEQQCDCDDSSKFAYPGNKLFPDIPNGLDEDCDGTEGEDPEPEPPAGTGTGTGTGTAPAPAIPYGGYGTGASAVPWLPANLPSSGASAAPPSRSFGEEDRLQLRHGIVSPTWATDSDVLLAAGVTVGDEEELLDRLVDGVDLLYACGFDAYGWPEEEGWVLLLPAQDAWVWLLLSDEPRAAEATLSSETELFTRFYLLDEDPIDGVGVWMAAPYEPWEDVGILYDGVLRLEICPLW